jgi:DNA modification methylase
VGNYRGNWSPYIPRNLILHYTAPGELVLDQMAGSGTTLVECKLLGRRVVGVDINPDVVMMTRNRLDFSYASLDADYVAPEIKTYVGDARCLDLIGSETIDLIATHPPYASIIPYSHDRVGDLSSVHNISEFQDEMRRVAVECMHVLKPGKHCAREKWFGKKYDFYLIGHEHLYVFRKSDVGERVTKYKESMKWL